MPTQPQVENMAFQQSDYPEAMQFQKYMDGTHMDSAGNNLIDPDLKTSMSPTHIGNPCDPPQMQRFLADGCGSTYFGHQQIDSKFQGPLFTTPSGVAPIPSAIHHRQESPPFTHPSSTCGSALSPPMESDYYHAQSPPTPPDTQSWPIFTSPYDSWGSQGQLYQHTGLADDCVKPIDVNPFQDSMNGFYEDSNAKSCMLVRGFSMSSDDDSSFEEQHSPSEQSQYSQPTSPESLGPEVKEEIPMAEPDPVYPPIDTDDEAPSPDRVEHPNVKIEDEDEEYQPSGKRKRSHSHTIQSVKTQKRANGSHTSRTKRTKAESNNTVRNIPSTKPSLKGAKSFPCNQCRDIVFKDANGLQKHIKTQHTRPFICVFHFAGCKSTFASKNEWKRHCATQHLLLNYWLCQQDQCAKVSNSAHTSKSVTSWQDQCSTQYNGNGGVPAIPNGAIFNRKDLYTQHLRRMHVPPNVKKQVKQKKPVPEWEDNIRSCQKQAEHTRCHLPSHMDCPAPGCKAEFEGPNAWDERMEHVAKHLDKAGLGEESPLSFGGDHDATLIEWAMRPDVSIIRRGDKGRWELHDPLRPTGHPRKGVTPDEEDEDAEGEEFDE